VKFVTRTDILSSFKTKLKFYLRIGINHIQYKAWNFFISLCSVQVCSFILNFVISRDNAMNLEMLLRLRDDAVQTKRHRVTQLKRSTAVRSEWHSLNRLHILCNFQLLNPLRAEMTLCHLRLIYIFNFWHSGTLALKMFSWRKLYSKYN